MLLIFIYVYFTDFELRKSLTFKLASSQRPGIDLKVFYIVKKKLEKLFPHDFYHS